MLTRRTRAEGLRFVAPRLFEPLGNAIRVATQRLEGAELLVGPLVRRLWRRSLGGALGWDRLRNQAPSLAYGRGYAVRQPLPTAG